MRDEIVSLSFELLLVFLCVFFFTAIVVCQYAITTRQLMVSSLPKSGLRAPLHGGHYAHLHYCMYHVDVPNDGACVSLRDTGERRMQHQQRPGLHSLANLDAEISSFTQLRATIR